MSKEISQKALAFARKAHSQQVRKSEPEKPMIIHPINAGLILSEMGFDDNVVAAAYLHDVVEDTKYTIEDIKLLFGEDIASLVATATEPNKKLAWLERKKHTIKTIKKMPTRHKAVVAADKIDNLEDIKILIDKNNNKEVSAFKGSYEDQKWYYQNVCKSLVSNEKKHPLFTRLEKLVDEVYSDSEYDLFLKNKIFNESEYIELKRINAKKQEIKKLKKLGYYKKPFVVEFTGTPRTGKTTLINNLIDFFEKGNYKVKYIEEFTTTKFCKRELYSKYKNKKYMLNLKIISEILKQIEKSITEDYDLILIDRGLFDRLIWMERLYRENGVSKTRYESYMSKFVAKTKKITDLVVINYADPLIAIKRDYQFHLSLEPRSFLTIENINEYNQSLSLIEKKFQISKEKMVNINTNTKRQKECSIMAAEAILNLMRNEIIEEINKKA